MDSLDVSRVVLVNAWRVRDLLLESRRSPGAAQLVRFADYPYAGGVPGFVLDPDAIPALDDPREDREARVRG